MGRSRRKYKQARAKVRVGLLKKNPNVFKPAFNIPPKLRNLIDENSEWDNTGTVIDNYKSLGFVSNPNLLGVRSRTPHLIETGALQVPPPQADWEVEEFEEVDCGSDLEEDDLKTALGKKRKDGKSKSLQPLTTIQRKHIGRLIEKYGDKYQAMSMDTKLNAMQHSVATLQSLCQRYHMYKDKNPLILPS